MICGLRSILIACLLVAGAFLIAVVALDHYLVAQGEHDLARSVRGESLLSFEFDQWRDLIGGGIEGAEAVAIDAGVLRASLPSGIADLRLNLRGLALDARRFDHLDARILVSAPAQLHLIFDAPGQLHQLTTAIELAAGWNPLQLTLSKLIFKPNGGGVSQSWGADRARVGEFRLYIAGDRGLQIGLDHVRFARHLGTGAKAAIQWLSATEAARRIQEGRPLRDGDASTLGVLLDVSGARPEPNLVLRDQLRQVDADTLFWPAWRGIPDTRAANDRPDLGWSPGWWLVGAYALLALWIRWRHQGPASPRSALELAVGLAPILALNLGLGLAEDASADGQAWLGASLLFQLSGLRWHGSSFRGSSSAWAPALKMLALVAAALLLTAAVNGRWQSPGLQRVGAYLPFVLLQQALLLGFLWPRLQVLSPANAQWLAAALFGLAHAPNFALMCLSMLAAGWWTGQFQQHRSWLPILTTHYLLGLLVISCLPADWLYSAETGLRYFLVK